MRQRSPDVPADFDLAAHWRSSTPQFQEAWPRYYATLRLEQRAANWMKMWRTGSPVQAEESPGEVGCTTLRVEFDHEEQACFVVSGLGARAEVIEPGSLRERVAADAAAGMSTIIEGVEGNSFAPVGLDELFREPEVQRRSVARKQEAECGEAFSIAPAMVTPQGETYEDHSPAYHYRHRRIGRLKCFCATASGEHRPNRFLT